MENSKAGAQEKVEDRVSEEAAVHEFDRFVEAMDLDIDESILNDADKEGLKLNRYRIIKAIRNGSLVVNDQGEPIFTPRRSPKAGGPFHFREPKGGDLMEMDRKKANQDVSKTYGVLGAITKQPQSAFGAMVIGDLNICTSIMTLFLA